MSPSPALPPRRGRRDNGLDATAFTSLGDVDPRVGEHLLDVLREAGIAAYLEPHSELNPYWRATALPSPPRDRLFVDRACDERAADLVTEHAEEPEPDPRPGVGSSSAAVDDAVWAELVASFGQDVRAAERPWPAAEDLPPRAERPAPRRTEDRPDDDQVPGWLTEEWKPDAWSPDDWNPDDWAPDDRSERRRVDLPPFDEWRRPPAAGDLSSAPGRPGRPGPVNPTDADTSPGASTGSGDPTDAGERPADVSRRPANVERDDPGGLGLGRSEAPDLSDLPSLDDEPATDPDEHYQPPPPPPFPTPSAATVRALVLLLAGAVMLVAPTLLGFGAETGFVLGVLGIVGGLGLLVFRIRERPPSDDGDNGAIV